MNRNLRAEIDLVAEASVAALRAPSILNSQPWRWRLAGDHAELWADRSRQLTGLDPDGRLLLLSCGAALHHAVAALHAAGFEADVDRLPDADRPDLVARFGRGGERPARDGRGATGGGAARPGDTEVAAATGPDRVGDAQVAAATAPDRPGDAEVGAAVEPGRLSDADVAAAIERRHTDRRPFGDERPAEAVLDELRAVAGRHGVHLQVVREDQVTAFAGAVAHAAEVERDDPRFRADLRAWTNRAHGDGVTTESVVATARRTVAPRDFAIKAGLAAGGGSDRGTVYALFVTDGDEPRDWLAAGEALSDVWLTLTARGLAASPISEVVEVAGVRNALRSLLGGVGNPAVGMRIGVPGPDDAPPATPRRMPSAVLS
ncbi:nitroreductase [Dactylosporangium sp. NPDC049140]|uniref:nitroreductase n=1 Tax=Dactylosporangium sp. NPDC049140 TaxID=3155647 RepID=UPI00340A959A